MNRQQPSPPDGLQRVDYLCDQFEAACRAGKIPSLTDYLVAVEESCRKELFRELLHLELSYRSQRSQTLDQKDYSARFPDYADIIADEFEKLSTSRTVGLQEENGENGIPENFGDYEFLSVIARGGMGIVYKAKQKSLNRVVALKMVLAGEFASSEMTERFQTEAELAAALNHPNIVPIYDFGHHRGRSFISMGYIEGTSLDAVISKSCFPPKIAARIVMTCARAVDYAHSKGVIHRDIKPQNILINEYREPVITDFGLAKNIDSDLEMTATGQVLGTANYMPPEQAAGVRDSVGPLADVYSLGATLYHMLVGRAPFESDGFLKTLKNVIEAEPRPLQAINPDVPRDLETICLKCLEKNPSRRYPSARDLADDLSNWLSDEPINARPASTLERTARWIGDRRGVVVLSVLLMISVLTGVFSSIYFANRTASRVPDSRDPADSQPGVTTPPKQNPLDGDPPNNGGIAANQKGDTPPVAALKPRNWSNEEIRRLQQELVAAERRNAALLNIRRAADRTANAEHLRLAEQAYYRNDLVEAKRRLDLIPAKVRFQKWQELDRRCRPEKVITVKGRVVGLKLNADATRLFVKTQSELIAYDVATKNPIWTAGVLGKNLDYCAKTDELLAGDSLFEASTGKVLTQRSGKSVQLLGFNPSGTRVAVLESNRLRVFRLSPTNRLLTGPQDVSSSHYPKSVRFSTDGNRLIGCNQASVAVWDISSRRAKSAPMIYRSFAKSIALMPDGSTFVLGMSTYGSAIASADDVQLLRFQKMQQAVVASTNGFVLPDPPLNSVTGKPGTRDVTAIEFSSDGTAIAFGQIGNMAHVIPLTEFTRKPWPVATPQPMKIHGTTNGYQSIVPGSTTRLTGQVVRMGSRVSPVNALAVMPKGDMLIAGRRNGRIEFWPTKPPVVKPPVIKQPPTKLPPGTAIYELASPGLGSVRLLPRGLHLSAGVRINGSKTPVLYSEGQFHPIPTSFPGLGGMNRFFTTFDVRGDRAAILDKKKIEVWDLKAGKRLRSFDTTQASTIPHLSDDGRFLVSLASQGLQVWDIDNNRQVLANSDLKFKTIPGIQLGICSSIDKAGRRLAVSTSDSQNITVFDLATGKLLYEKKTPGYVLLTSNKLIVLSKTNNNFALSLFEAETGKAIGGTFSTDRSGNDPPTILIDPQEKWLIFGKKNAIAKLDLATGKETQSVAGGDVYPISMAPDGKSFLTIGKQAITLWDSQTLQPIGNPIAGMVAQFSRDGGRIILINDLNTTGHFRFLSPQLKELPAQPKLPNF